MMPLSLNISTFLNIQGLKWNIYRCIIDGISKSEAINLLKKCLFKHKKWINIYYKNILIPYKRLVKKL